MCGRFDQRIVWCRCGADDHEGEQNMQVTPLLAVVAVGLTLGIVDGTGAEASATATCDGQVATIVGTPGDDVILANQEVTGQVIVGLGGNDSILGSELGDAICGGDGNDQIWAGSGNDTLVGGPGDDRLLGGVGTDAVDYGAAPVGMDVDLGVGTATGEGADVLDLVEVVRGSPFDDTIIHGFETRVLQGRAGADLLIGGPESEFLEGGAGNDVVYGGGERDLIYGDDQLSDTGAGNDALYGGPGLNDMVGGAGNDSLFPGPEPYWLIGGTGVDIVYFTETATGLTVDIPLQTITSPGGAIFAAITEIENVLGTPFADTLRGDAVANRLTGGRGDDVIAGGSGPDRLEGSDGGDRISGGATDSTNDADRVDGGGGNDVLAGGPDNDTFFGGNGIDHCDGGPGTDSSSTCETTTNIP
jgi:Ca2+-binding RTX toxin-like protein